MPKTSKPKTGNKEETPTAPEESALLVATVSRETLEETPDRVLPFLRTIGTTPAVQALMAAYGYEAEDHQEGWTLLHAASGFTASGALPKVDNSVREAIAALDRWDEDGFRLVRAALARRHPEQAEFVLEGLGPSTGPAAVIGVKKLLSRLDELEKGPSRKATRKEDHAALQTLAKRGIDAAERARLAALVKVAESVGGGPDTEGAKAREEREKAHVQSLIALRAWYEEWSEVARVAVKRRDYLIRMGLASRRAAKGGGGGDGGEPPTP